MMLPAAGLVRGRNEGPEGRRGRPWCGGGRPSPPTRRHWSEWPRAMAASASLITAIRAALTLITVAECSRGPPHTGCVPPHILCHPIGPPVSDRQALQRLRLRLRLQLQCPTRLPVPGARARLSVPATRAGGWGSCVCGQRVVCAGRGRCVRGEAGRVSDLSALAVWGGPRGPGLDDICG
jgi:hypothetical protein